MGSTNGPEDVGIVIAIGDVDSGHVVHSALGPIAPDAVLVTSATEALRALEEMRPALLVVDDELPLVRGLDLAGRVRSERSDVEIILLTHDDLVISVVSRLRVERMRCIRKPFDLEKLRQAVGVSSRALLQRGDSDYDDLAADLQEQKSHFERRIGQLERKLESEPPCPPDTPRPEPPERRTPTRELPDDLRILVVDDDPAVRRALARALRKQQVVLAENGRAATRVLERSQPDVIVSDLRMPEMNGFELAEEIRQRWPELGDRILFVSGVGTLIRRAEAEAPTQPVLRKPVDGDELANRIAEVLERAMQTRRR
jgi:DNA-binding response OmpR family regulator